MTLPSPYCVSHGEAGSRDAGPHGRRRHLEGTRVSGRALAGGGRRPARGLPPAGTAFARRGAVHRTNGRIRGGPGAVPAGLVLLPIAVRALAAFAGIHATVAQALLTTSRESSSAPAWSICGRRRHGSSPPPTVSAGGWTRPARRRAAAARGRGLEPAGGARAAEARRGCAGAGQRGGDEAQRAIGELRDLARGIHPAVLTDRGLGPALRTSRAARRCPSTFSRGRTSGSRRRSKRRPTSSPPRR